VHALMLRLTGLDIERCPVCQRGRLRITAILPPGARPRSPRAGLGHVVTRPPTPTARPCRPDPCLDQELQVRPGGVRSRHALLARAPEAPHATLQLSASRPVGPLERCQQP
jgi:hypothetical protein